jgi:rhamnogalacturonan endolyase
MKRCLALALAACLSLASVRGAYQMENLGRGVVAVRTGTSTVYVGWRLLGNDPSGIAFNLYRGSTKVNSSPLTTSTNLVDSGANLSVANTYTVRPVIGGVEQAPSAGYTLAANAPTQQYLRVPLQQPAGGTVPAGGSDPGGSYTYSPNDCSVGDLDGDGEYEIIVKWDPSNSRDNSQDGYTGNVYLDAYKLNGTRLWRIDLGRNIRAGAHYTQFMVYDLDGDGKAEIACKTGDGTISGTGQVIGTGSADWRNSTGRILSGPEYFTIFNGQTGAALATTNYVVPRGTVGNWGDTYGNRVDRFLACIAYLDGVRPSVVMCRGYYTRAVLAAWDWRNGQLTQRWVFDTGDSTSGPLAAYRGQGAHSLTVGDVDNDGKDEIIYGAATIDDNGTGKYSTGVGHGDALHMSDMNPNRAGKEVWMVHEDPNVYGTRGLELHDAATGAFLLSISGEGADVGRGCAGDIDPRYAGYEVWGARGGLYNVGGTLIGSTKPAQNFMCYWDADLLREPLDGTTIYKWNYSTGTQSALLTTSGVASNNSTKATPNLSADILGDWREEVIWRETGNTALRIYTTTAVATNRIYTLMHDRQYREAVAWQNVGYNQPPHPGFFLGDGMATPPTPDMYVPGGGGGGGTADTYQAESATLGGGAFVESTNGGFNGTGYINFPTTGGTLTFSNVDGNGGGTKSLAIRYANGSTGSRTGNLTVNGTTTSITFPVTGAWTTWTTLNVNVTLNNSTSNTIQLSSTGQDLANIDELTVP